VTIQKKTKEFCCVLRSPVRNWKRAKGMIPWPNIENLMTLDLENLKLNPNFNPRNFTRGPGKLGFLHASAVYFYQQNDLEECLYALEEAENFEMPNHKSAEDYLTSQTKSLINQMLATL
jgi:hypothetical protein